MSNLLEKASIITTPTAYDNGKLLSVKPSKPYSDEIAVNGNFDTDSDWSKDTGWTISNGEAIHTGSGSYISQTGTTIGKNYRVVIEVTQASGSGFPQIYMGGLTTAMTSVGTYTFDITATSTLIRLRGLNDCKVSSISVKEVLHADFDFTRGSSATRVNSQGLIEDVQILSGEFIQNGDFEQIGSELVTNGGFDTDSDWSKLNATISDGKGNLDGDGQTSLLWQDILINGKTYKAIFTVSDYNELGEARLMNNDGLSYYTITTNGTFTVYFKHTISNGNFLFRARSGAVFSIDNVSVKEVGQDWMPDEWIIDDDNGNQVMKFIGNAANQYLRQSDVYTPNDKIRLQFTLSNFTSGQFRVISTGVVWSTPTINATNGTFTYDIDTTGTSNGHIYFQAVGGSFNGYLDDVSVIKITDDTDLPRINYTNLIMKMF